MKKVLLFTFLTFSLVSFGQGLISSYSFNGNANDDNGSNNGTVYGATLTDDRFGNPSSAYSFDGINDYIALPASSDWDFGSNDFSISSWFLSTDGSNDNIIRFDNGYGPAVLWGVRVMNKKLQFLGGQGSLKAITGFEVVDNNWHHSVTVRNGNNLKIYYDGSLVVDSIVPATTNITTLQNYYPSIGRLGSYNAEYFTGKIDDIKIYDKDLTQAEIDDLYNGFHNNTSCTDTVLVTVQDTLNIYLSSIITTVYDASQAATTVKVYPNPTENEVTVSIDNYTNLSGVTLKVINSQSAEVHSEAVAGPTQSIDVSSWSAGIYFLQVLNGTDIVDIRKIVVNN